MAYAGGRLFVDVTQQLTPPATRNLILDTLGKSDPLLKDALTTVIEREDFLNLPPAEAAAPTIGPSQGLAALGIQGQFEDDPAIVGTLIRQSEEYLEALRRDIQTKTGVELFDFIEMHMREHMKVMLVPQSMGVILAAQDAYAWLNEKVEQWLGEKNVADTLAQSVPNNVTSEMGLALLDVADAIRSNPAVLAYLQQAEDETFLEELPPGGEAIRDFLARYGMRCAGEIDITKPRWSEKPTTLVPLILGNVKNFTPGAAARKFEQGRQEALEKERELLERLKDIPEAEPTKSKIDLVRNYSGYREYPKFGMVSRYFIYKQALMKEAEKLFEDKEDAYFLTFDEFREAVRTGQVDHALIARRKEEHKLFEKLTPPRILTSDGEGLSGSYRREDIPAGALVGLAVSSGVVEGRARVVLKIEDADLEEGDILVTAFTDPSWTPLFVSIKGLITEVGGLMTHGAVIAREYGLPAVVGVDNATRLIADGQRIRVHGTEGYVELLQSNP
jgi:pyruvate,water dikinase